MAGELQVAYITGYNLYCLVRNSNAQVWNTSLNSFGSYSTVSLFDYDIQLTEQGTASGYYVGNFPISILPGIYNIVCYVRSGVSPVEGDVLVASGTLNWNGSSLITSDPRVALIEGNVTGTPSASIFNGDSGLSSVDNFYSDSVLVFQYGNLKGIARKIISYIGISRTFTFDSNFPVSPAVNDKFTILGRIN